MVLHLYMSGGELHRVLTPGIPFLWPEWRRVLGVHNALRAAFGVPVGGLA